MKRTLTSQLQKEIRALNPEEILTAYLHAKTGVPDPEKFIPAGRLFQFGLSVEELITQINYEKYRPAFKTFGII